MLFILYTEEGLKQKARQRSSRLFGGRICSIPCRASGFASVYLEETVKFSRSIWETQLNSTISFKTTETKHLARQRI